MNEELVSVIITTYKRDYNMVIEAVESVIYQTYSNLEIIIIDDNGIQNNYSDGIKRISEKYPQIKYIKNEKNIGSQKSRNKGICLAIGNYIAFLDDDDIWVNNKIAEQMKMFNENIGMVYCKGYKINGNQKTKYYNYKHFKKIIKFENMLEKDYIGTTSQALIKKECLEEVGMFNEKMKSRQDYELWLRISRKYDIAGIDKFLFKHREHNGERISNNFTNALEGYYIIYEKYKEEYENNKKLKGGIFFYIAYYHFKNKNYKQFKENAKICFKCSKKKYINLIRICFINLFEK